MMESETIFGMSYVDAVTKSLEIVLRDGLHLSDEDSVFPVKTQIEGLNEMYTFCDPDIALQKLKATEGNEETLKNEVKFIIKCHLMTLRDLPLKRLSQIRLCQLIEKYGIHHVSLFSLFSFLDEATYIVSPLCTSFPDLEFKIKKDKPQLCPPLHHILRKYVNFKKIHDLEGVMTILPSGKKYGGYVKALLHKTIVEKSEDMPFTGFPNMKMRFQKCLCKFRCFYNSSNFSEEKRLEMFDKLHINEDDCIKWSEIFNKEFPGYENVHKFFGQIA